MESGSTRAREVSNWLTAARPRPAVILSAKMQALIKKIEAADAAHFAELRARGRQQAQQRAKTTAQKLQAARRRAAEAVRIASTPSDTPPKKKPPIKTPPLKKPPRRAKTSC
jgi:hypothetical protein